MSHQWGYSGPQQATPQQGGGGGGWGAPAMNAANWQQQQQQMAFQQPMVGGPAGVQGQGYYPMMQPASGGQPGNWAGANPNMAGGYQGFGQFQSAGGQSPMLHHTGFMPPDPQQQFHQQMLMSGGQPGPAFTAQHQQQLLLQQQQQQQRQQQLAMQEQMLKSQQEEMKRVEFERKQLRLKSIDVSRAAGPRSLESLIGFSVPAPSSSPKQAVRSNVANTAASDSKQAPQEKITTTPAATVQMTAELVATPPQQQLPQGGKPSSSSSLQQTQQSDSVSLEKLMANSMNLFDDHSTRPISKKDFSSSKPTVVSSTSSSSSSSPHHLPVSRKAHAWSVNTEELSGLFAQHSQQPGKTEQEDESFGDFQSGPAQPLQQPGTTLGIPSSVGGASVFNTGDLSTSGKPQQVAPPTNSPQLAHTADTRKSDGNQSGSSRSFRQDELPLWINYPATIPSIYHTVYEMSRSGDGDMTATDRLYPLLMSSDLDRTVLRDLWSMVNRCVAGRLNKQELFLLLALIGIVQSGKSNPSLVDLKETFHPPPVTLSAVQQSDDNQSSGALFGQEGKKLMQLDTVSQVSATPTHTDDFGDFQTSTITQSETSTTSLPQQEGDKYTVFHQLQEPKPAQVEITAPNDPAQGGGNSNGNGGNDIYSAFRMLAPTGVQAANDVLQPVGDSLLTGDISKPLWDGDSTGLTFPPSSVSNLNSSSTTSLPSQHSPALSDRGGKSQSGGVFNAFQSGEKAGFGDSAFGGSGTGSGSQIGVSSTGLGLTGFETGFQQQTQETSSQPTEDTWADFTSFTGSTVVGGADTGQSQMIPSSVMPAAVTVVSSTMFGVDTTTTTTSTVTSWPPTSSSSSSSFSSSTTAVTICPPSTNTSTWPPALTTSTTSTSPSLATTSSSTTLPLISTTSNTVRESSPGGFMDDFSEFSGYSSPPAQPMVANGNIGRAGSDLSHTSSPSSLSLTPEPAGKKLSQDEVWQMCLEKCVELLKTTLTVLRGSDRSALEEIVVAQEAKKKLTGIGELYRFAKRIHVASHGPGKKYMTPSTSEKLVGLMLEVRNLWTTINNTLPNNTMTKLLGAMSSGSLPPDDRDSPICSLCLFPEHIFISPLVTMDSYSEQYSLAMTRHNKKSFHTQCANFWQFAIKENIGLIP